MTLSWNPALAEVTATLEKTPLAKCFESGKENGNDEDTKGALHARIHA